MFSSFNARAVGLGTLSAEATIDLAADAGFDGVDLLVRQISETGENPRKLRERMDNRGLRGGAFPLPFDWRGDEESFQRDIESLPRWAEIAGVLNLSRTGTWVLFETPGRSPEHIERSDYRRQLAAFHVDRLGSIARLLDDYGIRLGLEVIGVESSRSGRGEPFVAKLGDLDHELGKLWSASPNFGILLDVFHLYAADEPIEAGLAWGIERVAWVHVADLPPGMPIDRSAIIDANRGLPGENGAVDVGGFLEKLARASYDGPVTAEPLSNCRSLAGLEPDAVARRVKRSLDSVWPRL